MDNYKDGLSSGLSSVRPWKTGDSIVRRYEVHDQQYFSIEQLLSIYVSTIPNSGQSGKQWFALVSSDCGKDLSQSPPGPWLGVGLPRRADYYTRFLPVPEHQLWTRSHGLPATFSSNVQEESKSTLRKLPQSLRKLPSTYKSFQDDVMISQDPLYDLSGIFGFFVSSEAQFSSFLATRIDVNSAQGQLSSEFANMDSLSNLLHSQKLLEGHIEELQYVLQVFQSHSLSSWPKSADSIAARTAASLQLDLDYPLKRACYLKTRCEKCIGLAMNVASIGEARRGIKHNKALFRFTVLASVYVPLSFTASVFGMNFKQFGQGELSVWLYVAVSVPVFAPSVLFLFFKPEAISSAGKGPKGKGGVK
ncbi:hypothetical protein BP6252_08902 [Coleophoma cylindrospora]|uniref:Uncharacterized protein n=1 Tax=Coleophoma cylindrospora TaxID=1849047 RepID=A0A3D8R0D9_9HELO|nr:hypothetical protein BP6252_08902 [Coleophoma cylindrospora]